MSGGLAMASGGHYPEDVLGGCLCCAWLDDVVAAGGESVCACGVEILEMCQWT